MKNLDLKGWNEKIKNMNTKTKINNILILVLIGILLVIVSSFFRTTSASPSQGSSDNKNVKGNAVQTQGSDVQSYEASVKDELRSVLSQVEGVGKIDLIINCEGGEEQVPAENINNSTSNTNEKDNSGGERATTQKNDGKTIVMTNDGDKTTPVIIKTYKPKITGILIIAEGAENRVTELRIRNAVTNLYNVHEDKVTVYPMKK